MAHVEPTKEELYKYIDDVVIPFLNRMQKHEPTEAFAIKVMLGKATGFLPDWRDDIRVPMPKQGHTPGCGIISEKLYGYHKCDCGYEG
jgi:hypothetical protein